MAENRSIHLNKEHIKKMFSPLKCQNLPEGKVSKIDILPV